MPVAIATFVTGHPAAAPAKPNLERANSILKHAATKIKGGFKDGPTGTVRGPTGGPIVTHHVIDETSIPHKEN